MQGNREPWQDLKRGDDTDLSLRTTMVGVGGKRAKLEVEQAGCCGHPDGTRRGPSLRAVAVGTQRRVGTTRSPSARAPALMEPTLMPF